MLGPYSGSAPSEAEFLQQLQYIFGGQFGLPRPGEGPPPQPAAADGGGGSQARTGRQTAAAAPEQSPPSGPHSPATDTQLPDLVAADGSSQVHGTECHVHAGKLVERGQQYAPVLDALQVCLKTADVAALQYESEWEEAEDGDEDAAAQVLASQLAV